MKKVMIIAGVLVLAIGTTTAVCATSKSNRDKKEERLTYLEQQEKELTKDSKMAPGDREKIADTMEEIASIEEELYPEEYYEKEILSSINTVGVAVEDMEIARKVGNISEENMAECNERIAKFGALVDELKTVYDSGECKSYESLYKKFHAEFDKTATYFEENY